MTIEDAKVLIAHGTPFGHIYPRLERASREELKEWYVNAVGLPNLNGREMMARSKSNGEYTGDSCPKCGSTKTVRTGTCFVCQECGESSGCG